MGNKTAPEWGYDDRVPSEPSVCSTLIGLLLDQLEQGDWTNKDTFGIHMAIEEALMNAICHGNKCSPEKQVHVIMKIFDDRFYAKITDQGEGFDPDDLPDPTDEENLEKTSGRGVMLIRSFVDQATYNERGNSLELTKQKTASKT